MSRVNRVNMRADKFEVVDILNMKNAQGVPLFEQGKSRLTKVVDRYTMECPECGTIGRVDENGDTVCDDDSCAVVLNGKEDPLIYPERGFSSGSSSSDGQNIGSSGRPGMTTPALNPAGPAGDN